MTIEVLYLHLLVTQRHSGDIIVLSTPHVMGESTPGGRMEMLFTYRFRLSSLPVIRFSSKY